jgi:hypothetical protein
MLPLMIFEVMYKVLYLILVSYPLWSANRLAGSPEEEMTFRFLKPSEARKLSSN